MIWIRIPAELSGIFERIDIWKRFALLLGRNQRVSDKNGGTKRDGDDATVEGVGGGRGRKRKENKAGREMEMAKLPAGMINMPKVIKGLDKVCRPATTTN
ncbi:hypothetical protein KQX54_003773 [Cotesia glomerata]|uniref:DUF4283 domain-containing protein n=1 Tax=Cotesia glomerata TaxID=32391 RepID=A0AAV7J2I1_COTGL|nr:hypothetical protein KQX54_003773 [Cotesia glomerata]